MVERKGNSALAQQPSVLITRLFDAPRQMVFEAWTDPEQLMQWYAPQGCTITFRHIDVRPGGRFHSCIRSASGDECWCMGEYREVMAPERLVFSMAISNKQGELVGPADVGMDPEWPKETVVTITLAEVGGKTELTLHQTVGQSLAQRTGALPSWLQMLDHLAAMLEQSTFGKTPTHSTVAR